MSLLPGGQRAGAGLLGHTSLAPEKALEGFVERVLASLGNVEFSTTLTIVQAISSRQTETAGALYVQPSTAHPSGSRQFFQRDES